LFLTEPARGQAICGERDEIIANLDREYGERLVAHGIVDQQNVLERFESRDGTTWTLLLTGTDGWSCPIAAGEAWQPVMPVVGEPS
jgi:hypothetical protein